MTDKKFYRIFEKNGKWLIEYIESDCDADSIVVTNQKRHLLDQEYDTWEEAKLAATLK